MYQKKKKLKLKQFYKCAVWPAKRLPGKLCSCYLDTQFLVGAWEILHAQVKDVKKNQAIFCVYVVRGPPVQRLPGR